ncbi:MAG: sirohydrochlorin cobaltochelatase [SAR324 cluster bacterium]|uniref:Sirohydrochlorin cobaltochelatase n=1 Tax=SAR324 cluster bacterium TaxID=2024889 RepID=A0A2A4SV36_9DELT|nr:MAG: sirohydrochlorin cobaltochelatase [SAR324 cluster bacterium]
MSCPTATKKQTNKKAIVLAHFGTTVLSALKSLDATKEAIREAFPETPIAISFTSNIIRGIWARRRVEAQLWLDQGVPQEFLYARSILGVIGDLQDQGFRSIIVQPTHIAHGEQYEDLRSYIEGLQSIQTIKKRWMPFEKIVCSRPTLGTHGVEFNYHSDIEEVVSALSADIELARKHQADLVYAGHGNEYFSTGVYQETQQEFRRQYPDVKTFIGLVEGYPSREDLLVDLHREGKKNIILKPFMLTAGDHACNDIGGDEEDSWKNRLTEQGFNVMTVLEGLGSNPDFSRLYAKRIHQTAELHGINLQDQES